MNCKECKDTKVYQPLTGPSEPCRACRLDVNSPEFLAKQAIIKKHLTQSVGHARQRAMEQFSATQTVADTDRSLIGRLGSLSAKARTAIADLSLLLGEGPPDHLSIDHKNRWLAAARERTPILSDKIIEIRELYCVIKEQE